MAVINNINTSLTKVEWKIWNGLWMLQK